MTNPKSLFLADADFLTREQAKSLCDRALAFAKADETRVNITSGWSGNTRFAGNEITTSGGTTKTTVSINRTVGKRTTAAHTDREWARHMSAAGWGGRPKTPPCESCSSETPANLDPQLRATATKQTI